MAAAYPQTLISQRTLLQLQEDYDNALIGMWRRAVDIQGLLFEGGLSAPGFSSESPIASMDGSTFERKQQ